MTEQAETLRRLHEMRNDPKVRELQAASQDDDTRRRLAELASKAIPRLMIAGWSQRAHGNDGLGLFDNALKGLRLIHSLARESDLEVWSHVSISRRDHKLPTWEQTRDTFRLLHPDVVGVIVIPPADEHVNLREVQHVWACLSRRAVPDFTRGMGTI